MEEFLYSPPTFLVHGSSVLVVSQYYCIAGNGGCRRSALEIHAGDVHGRPVAFHHDDATLSYVVELAIALKIVTDHCVWGHAHVLVQNGPANAGAAADIAVVEDNRTLHAGVGVNPNAAADYRSSGQ